jgi:TonB family protein
MRWIGVALLSLTSPAIALAQNQEKKIGALTTDVRLEVDARDNGDVVIRGSTLISTIVCVSQPATVREWIKASSQTIDSTSAANEGASRKTDGQMLSGLPDCRVRVVRASDTSPNYRVELNRASDDARVAATMSTDDVRHLLSFVSIAADSAESMAMQRDPTLLSRRAALFTPASEPYFEFQVERQAWPLESNPHPQYPPELRNVNYEGEVLAQFVVDTTGRVERETFKVLKSSSPLFTSAVSSVLPELRFTPAQLGGRKVRQLVRMPFEFALTR